MGRVGFVRRHRVALASNTAIVVAAGAVLAYAVAADGYQAHQAELNDGGIWVVHGDRGIYGRINKPINQLDTIVFSDAGQDRLLDVVQDGAVVAAIDARARTAQVIDPATSTLQSNAKISIPTQGDQQAAGGTFASIDTETGDVWAVQLDPQRGTPLISSLDAQSDPLDTVGAGAALAVSQSGTVVATSADKGTVTYLVPHGDNFDKPRTEQLPSDAGSPKAVTTVGERVVTLDPATGQLSVIGAGSATLPPGGVLQQPGPVADSVLVATSGSLLSVDLQSGEASVVDDGFNDRPAEPVRLGACSYAAWSGGLGEVTVQCGDDEAQSSKLGGDANSLTFRVNRGEIVLNDNSSGTVWDVDAPEPEKIDNWNAFTASKQVEDKDKQNDQQSSGDRTPPKAEPDSYGARAGRTTILHPLDNDSAPKGRLLSIIDVAQPPGGASAQISPDGQTIVLQLPDDARNTSFDYTIDDGRSNFTAHATVAVTVREATENEQPALRAGFEPHRWQVPAGGSITVPVLSDWRDDADGDALVLDSAATAEGIADGTSDAVARTTSDGRVRFTGSFEGDETVQVDVAVSDGRTAPVKQTLTFDVQGRLDLTPFSATAAPDVVRGEVNTPIKIRPLLNDLPGSDPSTVSAELTLGGKIPGQSGADITTDVENGIITFTGDRPGTYFLDYDAAFGTAPLDRETVRIDVLPTPESPGDPIAMPDTLTVYGQAAGIIDVLANDVDPAGGLLVVQLPADNPSQLDVAVIDGRWLRISAPQGDLSPNPQLVHYTISNGATSGIEGEVSVSHRQAPADNSPVTVTDRVHVRGGSSVTAPVLDNDIAPSGDRLTLVGDAAQLVPGELQIDAPADVTGDLGTAYVSGRSVRYIAPDLKERDSFNITYIARSSTGETSPGKLTVIITPADAPNTAPEPPTLEGRAVSAASIKVRLPGTGVDPDGDPVTVAGITSAPRFGRVLSYGGNFLEYQAYPRTTGTDEFEYAVIDSRGAVATGIVRVAVVPPGEPQRPLAVDDQLTVQPGRTAVFDPLANDFIAPGDEVRIRLIDAPLGVSLDARTNLVSVPAPDEIDAPSPQVFYEITNGIDTSRATLKVGTDKDFENPPVVFDAFGKASDSGSVSVDVLDGAYDPDGTIAELRVTKVYGTEGDPTIDGDKIRVNRGPHPLVVPFRVEDANGAAASASLYVPPTGTGIPYVKPDSLIQLDEGGSAKGKLSDFIVNPSGDSLRLTGSSSVFASPSSLHPDALGNDGFEISARDGYRGPGALLLEVTTATNKAGNEDPQDPTDGYTALLSIPVQVGDDRPVLTCPQTTIPISAGEVYDLDVGSVCNVWTPDPADEAGLVYEGSWTQEVEGLSVDGNGGAVLHVTAADDANRGGEAALSITAAGSAPAEIRFRLATAPPPSMLPIRAEDLDAGQSREIDLAPYLVPGVADPTPTLVSVDLISGTGVTARPSGRAGVTLQASKGAAGRAVFRVVMSDVEDSSPGAARRAEGRIEVELAGLPGQPGQPHNFDNPKTGTVRLGWAAPKEDGGSPITHYVLRETRHPSEITCRTTECDFPGLEDRKKYNFRVAAVNKVGMGPWSELSVTAYAATKPGRVSDIVMLDRGDHTITIGWSKPQSVTPIEQYHITAQTQNFYIPGNKPTYTIGGLDNNEQYFFSIEALNEVGWSPPRQSAAFQSIGTPAAVGQPTVVDRQSGSQATDVTATWTATAPEGPAPTLYSLAYTVEGGALVTVPGCSRIQATTCTHSGVVYDGKHYAYYVLAHNSRNTSPPSAPAAFTATGKPAAWGPVSADPTGVDNQIRVSSVAPDSRGDEARAAILVGGQVVWERVVSAGAVINELVPTPGNNAAYPVEMRMCNENSAMSGCSMSSPRSAQSYGPIRSSHLNQVTSQVDGLNVTWTISGTSNGDPANVGISVDGGAEGVVALGAAGDFSFARTVPVGDYNRRTTIRVRLFDDTPAGRGETSVTGEVTTGDPPPPAIRIFKRASCNDADVDSNGNPVTANDCANTRPAVCAEASCGLLGIEVTGARAAYGCLVTRGQDTLFSYPYVGNQTGGVTDAPWTFRTGTIDVTCEAGSNGSNYFRVTASMTWP